jgi:hypothetical protein
MRAASVVDFKARVGHSARSLLACSLPPWIQGKSHSDDREENGGNDENEPRGIHVMVQFSSNN